MSWLITPTWAPADADAAVYITAVEAADTAAGSPGGLEERTKIAIDNFVLGCKADGIWNAIKASCILAGARTLSGALVPLVGAAPTNYNFVSGDYNRKTGLVGNESTKYLNTGRSGNADPSSSNHFSVYLASSGNTGVLLGSYESSNNRSDLASTFIRNRSRNTPLITFAATTGFIGSSRVSIASFLGRRAGTESSVTGSAVSVSPEFFCFATNNNGTAQNFSTARLAFYSIGESLDLALLDARVTTLINAIAAAIP